MLRPQKWKCKVLDPSSSAETHVSVRLTPMSLITLNKWLFFQTGRSYYCRQPRGRRFARPGRGERALPFGTGSAFLSCMACVCSCCGQALSRAQNPSGERKDMRQQSWNKMFHFGTRGRTSMCCAFFPPLKWLWIRMGDRRGDVCPFTVTNAKNECWFLSPSVAQFGAPRACAPAALPVPFPTGLAKLSPHEWPVVGAVAGGNTGTTGTTGTSAVPAGTAALSAQLRLEASWLRRKVHALLPKRALHN